MRRKSPTRTYTGGFLSSLLLVLGIMSVGIHSAWAQSDLDPIIEAVRELAESTLGADRQGSAYAALINFAINPDISAASYTIDSGTEGGDDPRLDVFRLPLRKVFDYEGRRWRPFVQATFSYQTYGADIDLGASDSVDSEWRAFGGSLAAGAEVPLGEHWQLIPAINLGIARLENNASYHGVLANEIFKPALQGLFFDWDADAWLAGVSLGALYQRQFQDFEVNVHGNLTQNYIRTFRSSSGDIDFHSYATTLDLEAETVHPTPWSIGGSPLALVAQIGNTTFLGPDADALGFEYFFEAGLGLEADVSEKDWSIQKLRVGAKAIFGDDVKGWSIIFGYRF